MPRHDPRPSFRCRADAEARGGGYKRCGRSTKNSNECCHDHQHFAKSFPDLTIVAPATSDRAMTTQASQGKAA